MNVLEINDGYFAYPNQNKQQLKNINITIKEGSITSLLGANGSGKSSLLMVMNGLNKLNKGHLSYKNKDILTKKDYHTLTNEVALLFQNPDHQLFLDNVAQDIAFGLKNQDIKDYQNIVQSCAKQLHIEHLLTSSISSLSFGQKKKVALAGLLVMKPKILLLDEPTAGLDAKGIKDLISIILSLNKQENITIILCSHELDLIAEFTQKIILLDDGYIRYNGNSESFFNNEELLKEYNLEPPILYRLISKLNNKSNYNLTYKLTLDKTCEELSKYLRKDEKE